MASEVRQIRAFLIGKLSELAGGEASDVDEEENLVSQGLIDSLGFIELVTAIEKNYNVEIDFSELEPEEFMSVKGLVQQISNSLDANT